MSWKNFIAVKKPIESLGIRSILGVVPENRDPSLQYSPQKSDFFDLLRKFHHYGDAIVQHGTYHCYTSNDSGILGINSRSEFSGLSYIEQFELIRAGKNILQNQQLWEPYFMAPAHSFDANTIKALRDLNFIGVTDGFGFFPYIHSGLKFIPALTSSPFNVGFGYCTICLHTNTMTEALIERFLEFASKNHAKFVDFKELMDLDTTTGIHHGLLRQMTRYGLKGYRWLRQTTSTK